MHTQLDGHTGRRQLLSVRKILIAEDVPGADFDGRPALVRGSRPQRHLGGRINALRPALHP